MNKKVLLITAVVLAAVLAVAGVLYPKLSAGMEPQQLATTPAATTEPAPTATDAPAETTMATEAEEPETVAAPDFAVQDWDGNEVSFSDFAGKPIVLNFWAHWCGPCQYEMPEFNAKYEELGGEVTFLMVHADEDSERGKEAVADAGYTFTMVFDEKRNAKMTYGVNSYPITFFIDAQGNLKAYYSGMMGEDVVRQGIDLIYTAE